MDEFVWDDDQFRFNEKVVKGNYAYIEDKGKIEAIYEACINFLKNGTVPKHVKEHTLKSLSVFGL